MLNNSRMIVIQIDTNIQLDVCFFQQRIYTSLNSITEKLRERAGNDIKCEHSLNGLKHVLFMAKK